MGERYSSDTGDLGIQPEDKETIMEQSDDTKPSERTFATFAEDCPCEVLTCELRGHCVECVAGHRKHRSHLPECMQPMLRDLVEQLASKVEYGVVEERPNLKE
jgi:hypothetical protein